METCHDACRRVVAAEDAAARCFETNDPHGFDYWMLKARAHASDARRLRMTNIRLRPFVGDEEL